jgi:uncharacterized protein (DUF1697 family)
MPELAALFADLGLRDVTTYLQSGNVVFSGEADAAAIERGIAERFGYEIPVILRTPADLERVMTANPFLADEEDPARLHVVFLAAEPAPEAVGTLDANRSPPDRFQVDGREIYLHTPAGIGRSKLTLDWFERRLGLRGTARNWNTVGALLAIGR